MKREMKLPGWLFGFLCVISMATATWAQGLEENPRPTMLWVTGRAVRDPMRKAPDYDSSYEASGPAILLTGDGLLLMSTQKLGNLTVPWRLKTSGLSGKSHTVHSLILRVSLRLELSVFGDIEDLLQKAAIVVAKQLFDPPCRESLGILTEDGTSPQEVTKRPV